MKPRVLQLIDSFEQGGSERQAVQLTRLLHQSGNYQVSVATLNPGGVLRVEIDALQLGDIPSYPLNSFYDRNAVVQLRRFVRHLKESKIDILHTHDFYTNIFGMAASAIARLPVRIASRRETSGMRNALQQQGQSVAFKLAHEVLANSEAVKDTLIKEGVRREKIAVIYNGLDLERLSPSVSRKEALQEFGIPEAATRVVTIVANMRHDVKDYPMFLRAAAQVHRTFPDTVFLLAGEGQLTEQIRELARELGLARNSFFLGRCERVPDLLSISSVCVLSSKAEGFSNSILEYMAAGKPVVATDVGGAKEAIVEAETGFLVQSGDHEMMAQRIITLLSDPERATKMGEVGRARVEQKFSCEAQLQNTEDLYQRLLARRRSGVALKMEGITSQSI